MLPMASAPGAGSTEHRAASSGAAMGARTLGRDGIQSLGEERAQHQVPITWEGSAPFPEDYKNNPKSRPDDDQMSDTGFVLHLCF